jgi:TP901 family phage tail tape measure protein
LLTVRLGKTTFPELSESIGRVASSGNALGVSQEELFASFATLSGVTGKTTEVSTQMSAVLGGMMKPTEGMKKLMKQLGYSSTEAMVKEKGLTGTLDVLSQATGGSTAKLGKLFESKEALLAITALLGPQAQTYTDKLKEMNNASGTTAAALNEQENGINKVGNEFEKAKQKLMVTAIRIGDRLLPVVTKLTDKLVPLLEKITSLSDEQLEFGLKIAGFAALAGPAIWAMGSLVTSVMALRDGYLLLKVAMGGPQMAQAAAQASLTQQDWRPELHAADAAEAAEPRTTSAAAAAATATAEAS